MGRGKPGLPCCWLKRSSVTCSHYEGGGEHLTQLEEICPVTSSSATGWRKLG